MRFAVLMLVGCCVAFADDATPPSRAVAKAPAAGRPEDNARSPAETPGDIRDVLLMLDDGPLHLRFHLSLTGRSLTAVREDYVDRLMRSLDTDGDGRLSREEASHSPLLTSKRRSGAPVLDPGQAARPVERKEILQSVERVG